jgi:GNAT superfamily N-acetyltransferase
LFELRDFSEGDAQALTEIGNEAFGEEIARGFPAFTPDRFVKMHEREGVKFVIAEFDKSVAGFLVVTVGDEAVPAQVHLVGVEKGLRGRGIGKELVKFSIQYAKEVGKKKLRLYTRPWNLAMRKVCLDTGFIPEAYLKKEYLNEDLIQFSLFLE